MKQIQLFILSLSLIISNFTYSQDFPTIGEIFDYDIGDIFHTKFVANSYGGGGMDDKNIEIIDKYYSLNNDTVFYVRSVVGFTIGTNNPEGEYYELISPIYYANLNDQVIGDTMYQDPDLYNNRFITNHYYYSNPEATMTHYVPSCGIVYYRWDSWDGGSQIIHTEELVYYKKGDEEWGEKNTIVGIFDLNQRNRFDIYPNPVRNFLNIKIANPAFKENEIEIFNSIGKLIHHQGITSSNLQVNVSSFPNGIYFINQVDESRQVISRSKFVKVD